MRQTADWRCPCSSKFKVLFKKPHVVEPTIIQKECPDCKSTWLLKVRVGKEKGQVMLTHKPQKISLVLREILKEEAEFNAMPLEKEVHAPTP